MADNDRSPKYVNFAQCNHTQNEFVLSLGSAYPVPNEPNKLQGNIVGQYVMTPDHMKRLVGAMAANIAKYEEKHGEIAIRGGIDPNKDINLN